MTYEVEFTEPEWGGKVTASDLIEPDTRQVWIRTHAGDHLLPWINQSGRRTAWEFLIDPELYQDGSRDA